MCGIVYVQRKDNKPAHKQLWKRYKSQKHRGMQGFGYIGIKQSLRATDVYRFQFEHETELKIKDTKLSTILFHHRYPTSTANIPEATHPIKVSHEELKYEYYVTHNGVLNNEEDLKDQHEKLGYKYSTQVECLYRTRKGATHSMGIEFNDSEALAIELARNIEGLTTRCKAEGSIAYVVLQVDKQSKQAVALYYGTNGRNPLTIDDSKDYLVIASEGGTKINDNICYRLSYPDGTITEYLQVQMALPAQSTVSYSTYTHTGLGFNLTRYDEGDEYDDYGLPRKQFKSPKTTPSKDTTLADLEEQLNDLQDEIIGLQADIDFARNQGDMEEEEMYQQEFREAVERLDTLNDLYVKQANKREATAQ